MFDIFQCPKCHGDLMQNNQNLICECGARFPIICDVPTFIEFNSSEVEKTSLHYGDGWMKSDPAEQIKPWHYNEMVKLFDFPKGLTGIGFEGGCGHGKDTIQLALANPDSTIIAVDLSEGAYVTAARLRHHGIKNVRVIRCDLAKVPLKDKVIDWTYSFGVLHHMPDPEKGIGEISRISKPGSSILTYLYTDLREKPILWLLHAPIFIIRRFTLCLSIANLWRFCKMIAPFIFIALTLPARLLKYIGLGSIAESIPYHHIKQYNNLYGELYDRFGARFEYRYNPNRIRRLYESAGVKVVDFGQITIWRGWVTLGRKS